MPATTFLRRAKRGWFESIRKRRMTRLLQDLDNYLTNIDFRLGPPVGVDRVLVLSPHPDDESIGCGGTLALLARRGVVVDVVFMTSGAPPDDRATAETREGESRKAAQVLGLNTLHFIHGQDGQLHLQPWLSTRLAELIDAGRYPVIFCPWLYDGHSDHMATFRMLKQALRETRHAPELWMYEVWAPLMANCLVDIDDTIELKRAAIECHQSQLQEIDYTKKFMALARYRSLNCRPAEHAEAFLVCTLAMVDEFGLAPR